MDLGQYSDEIEDDDKRNGGYSYDQPFYAPDDYEDLEDDEEQEFDDIYEDYDGQDEYGGDEYQNLSDQEEDAADTDEQEESPVEDGQQEDEESDEEHQENEGDEAEAAPDGAQAKGKEKGWVDRFKNKDLEFSDIVEIWKEIEKNPVTKPMVSAINSTVREGLGTATFGLSYLITIFDGMYPIQPVTSLLEMFDPKGSGILGQLVLPTLFIEKFLNMMGIKEILIPALEALDKAGKASGAVKPGAKNAAGGKVTAAKISSSGAAKTDVGSAANSYGYRGQKFATTAERDAARAADPEKKNTASAVSAKKPGQSGVASTNTAGTWANQSGRAQGSAGGNTSGQKGAYGANQLGRVRGPAGGNTIGQKGISWMNQSGRAQGSASANTIGQNNTAGANQTAKYQGSEQPEVDNKKTDSQSQGQSNNQSAGSQNTNESSQGENQTHGQNADGKEQDATPKNDSPNEKPAGQKQSNDNQNTKDGEENKKDDENKDGENDESKSEESVSQTCKICGYTWKGGGDCPQCERIEAERERRAQELAEEEADTARRNAEAQSVSDQGDKEREDYKKKNQS